MFPTAAFDLLQFDLLGAASLAGNGDIGGGHEMLIAGLQRVEARQHLERVYPWAEDLRRYYRQALVNYEQRYGTRLLGSPRGAGAPGDADQGAHGVGAVALAAVASCNQ